MKDKSTIWQWVTAEAVVLICWTVLAVVFHKWWIALFAALFTPSIKWRGDTYCDNCGKRIYHSDLSRREEDLRKAGWVTVLGKDGKPKDFCPDCHSAALRETTKIIIDGPSEAGEYTASFISEE